MEVPGLEKPKRHHKHKHKHGDKTKPKHKEKEKQDSNKKRTDPGAQKPPKEGIAWPAVEELNMRPIENPNDPFIQGSFRNQPVAIRQIFPTVKTTHLTSLFKSEVEALAAIRHPFILLVICAAFTKNGTEFYVGSGEHPTLVQKFKIAHTLSLALSWLQKSPMKSHKSLSSRHVMVTSSFEAKLDGFGLSELYYQSPVDKSVDRYWKSPEVIEFGTEATSASDIYSFALVLWSLFLPQTAQSREPYSEIKTYSAFCEHVVSGNRPPIDDIHPAIASLLSGMWQASPEARTPIETITVNLPNLMIEANLGCPHAQSLWKESVRASKLEHLDSTVVKKHIFFEKLFQSTGEPKVFPSDPQYRCLDKIFRTEIPSLGSTEPNFVKLERFSQLLQWMGPLKTKGKTSHWIHHLTELMREPWFHGEATKAECDVQLVSSKSPGSFLVRFSSADPKTPFTLAKLDSKTVITNTRIQSSEEGYSVTIDNGSKKFVAPSVPLLILQLKGPVRLGEPIKFFGYQDLFVVAPLTGCY